MISTMAPEHQLTNVSHLHNQYNLSPNGHSFRTASGGFCRLDSYNSPGMRNALARWIHHLLRL